MAKPSPKMTAAKRAKLPPSSFGLPAQKAYPLDTPKRAQSALGRAKSNATPAEQSQIRAAVKRKYPAMQVTGKNGKPMAKPATATARTAAPRAKRTGKSRSK